MNEAANVIPMQPVFTDEQYAEAKQTLINVYGQTTEQRTTRYEQELARLFARSGWTQERLAQAEGKTQRYISYRLTFGQFLLHVEDRTMVLNQENLRFSLSERRFRGFWEQTSKESNDRQRFDQVLKLIGQADIVVKNTESRKQIGAQIVKEFGNGAWHSFKTIADAIGDETAAADALKAMTNASTTGLYGAITKRHHYHHKYQLIVLSSKKVDMAVLLQQAGPIIDELIEEGKTHMARISPHHIGILAHRLKKILEDLAK